MSSNKGNNLKRNLKIATGTVLTVGVMSLSLLITPKIVLAKETGATLSEMVSYTMFEHELNSIKQENNITFHNPELFNLLKSNANGELTIEYLHSISSIILEEPLSNNDLSDLKYLPNLTRLEVCGMNIDCNDLIYNQKLIVFNAVDCNLSNLNELPNTVTDLYLQGATLPDNIVYVPYHTRTLEINNTNFNKIHFKNPEELTSFTFEGYALLDLADLKECTNLKTISLTRCPNVSNSHLLKAMSSLSKVTLDDYSCIWLDKETLNSIDLDKESKEKYLSYIEELNQIATEINNANKTEEEKLNAIIVYITDKIDYDIRVSEEQKGYKTLVTGYNTSPIYFALNKDVGICVNYACLFTALANRVDIDNYQPSSTNHTWNMARLEGENEYSAYDMNGLDSDEIRNLLLQNITNDLSFYSFDLESINNPDFETNIKPIIISNIVQRIGYLKSNTLKGMEAQLFLLVGELIVLYTALSTKLHYDKKREEQNTKTFKYKRV